MTTSLLFLVVVVLMLAGFFYGRRHAVASIKGQVQQLHSLPGYYGVYVCLWCGLPALALVAIWLALEPKIIQNIVMDTLADKTQTMTDGQITLMLNDIRNLATGNITSHAAEPYVQAAASRYLELQNISQLARTVCVVALAIMGLVAAKRFITPKLRARNRVEQIFNVLLILSSLVAILTTLGIVLSLLFEALRFFEKVSVFEFLFGLEWSPQVAIRADQVGASGKFGVLPLLAGTLLISAIAMFVAAPIGLLSAIYMAEYANPKFRSIAKPLLEILAGVPTVVYGFFAALTIAPLMRNSGAFFGLGISSESALAAGLVMGIMIIPFVSSLSDDVITAVPKSLREGAYGLGATKSETIKHVILPAALPGIVGSLLLAVSNAIGETMIVVMAAGLAANLTANPFEAVTTVTVQIVTLLIGDQEFDSAKTLAAFALGLILFVLTLMLNIIALHVVRKYREQYD